MTQKFKILKSKWVKKVLHRDTLGLITYVLFCSEKSFKA